MNLMRTLTPTRSLPVTLLFRKQSRSADVASSAHVSRLRAVVVDVVAETAVAVMVVVPVVDVVVVALVVATLVVVMVADAVTAGAAVTLLVVETLPLTIVSLQAPLGDVMVLVAA